MNTVLSLFCIRVVFFSFLFLLPQAEGTEVFHLSFDYGHKFVVRKALEVNDDCFGRGFIQQGETDEFVAYMELVLIRTNSSGDIEWAHRYHNGFEYVNFYSIRNSEEAPSEVVLAGYQVSGELKLLMKISSCDGSIIWVKSFAYNGLLADAIVEGRGDEQRIYTIGQGDPIKFGQTDVVVGKFYGADGSLEWQKRYRFQGDDTDMEEGQAIIFAGDTERIVITGPSKSFVEGYTENFHSYIMTIFKDTGSIDWIFGIGNPDEQQWPVHLTRLSDGNFLVTTVFDGNVVKIGVDGTLRYSKKFHPTDPQVGNIRFSGSVELGDGSILSSGYWSYNEYPVKNWGVLIRYTSDGSEIIESKVMMSESGIEGDNYFSVPILTDEGKSVLVSGKEDPYVTLGKFLNPTRKTIEVCRTSDFLVNISDSNYTFAQFFNDDTETHDSTATEADYSLEIVEFATLTANASCWSCDSVLDSNAENVCSGHGNHFNEHL